MTAEPFPEAQRRLRPHDTSRTTSPGRRGLLPTARTSARRIPVLGPAVSRTRAFARDLRPQLALESILEQLGETLERREEQRCLEQARAGRDVCWPDGADDPGVLVTVRIATYNRGKGILRALESVAAQTYRNLEILVIGDSCDDATADAVMGFADPRVRFVNLPTRGMYPLDPIARWRVAGTHPMNAGLALARGAWLAPCDDDDEMTPHHVEHLLERAVSHRLELVWSRTQLQEQGGRLTSARFEHGEISHGSVLYSSGLRFFRHSNTSWKRNEPGDWNLWRRMRAAGVRIGWLDELTYIHY